MSDEFNTEDFLAHYGVLGMKWGVRKDKKSSSPRTTKTSDNFDVSKEVKTIRFKQNRKMTAPKVRTDISTSELRKINERLRLEIEYDRQIRELAKQNMSRSDRVKKDVQVIIGKASRTAATNLLTAKLTQTGSKALQLKVKEK